MSASNLPAGAPIMDFEQQVADILYDLYAHGPRGRLSAVTLREHFAPRVAAAILAAIGEVPLAVLASHEPPDAAMLMRPRTAALAALRGETP